MAVILVAALVGLLALGAWHLRRLHRAMAAMDGRAARIVDRVDGELGRLWKDVEGLHAEHLRAVEARVRRAESAAAQIAREHGQLARHVAWMEPWVRHWATGADDA